MTITSSPNDDAVTEMDGERTKVGDWQVYGIDDSVEVTVTFSAGVTVTGKPQLELDVGGSAKAAEYKGTDGTNVKFSYTVAENDEDTDGVSIGANKLTLNGGTIRGDADQDADLSHDALSAQKKHKVDGIRPSFKTIRFSASNTYNSNGYYEEGEEVFIKVQFSEGSIYVSGTPQLTIGVGGKEREATFERTSFGDLFVYTVQEGDLDLDGPSFSDNSISMNGGYIRDGAGNDVKLSHSGASANQNSKVDAVAPTVSAVAITSDPGADDTYAAGDMVEVSVTFSEEVWVPDTSRSDLPGTRHPVLDLRIGNNTRSAESGLQELGRVVTFTYTIQSGDTDTDGISINANGLRLNGGVIFDAAGNNPISATIHNFFDIPLDAVLPHDAVPDDSGHKVTTYKNSATGAPTITGTLQVGETLTADTTGIADEDGLTNAQFSYQWVRSDGDAYTNIQDATESTYTLVADDEGKTVNVTVSFTDAGGNPETLTSDPTREVAAKPNTQATGVPTISGTVRVGETLTADVTGIADEDGLDNVTFSYQWMADDANKQDATGSSYTLPEDDEGRAIKVTVSFTDAEGNPETLTSDPTGEVAAAPAQNIQATGVPTISGTLQVGETLTADTTGIADADGLTTVSYSYQWMADDTNIQGATGSTYTLTEDDEGKAIKVLVSFADDVGNMESRPSAPTDAVAAPPVQNSSATGAPSISGTAQVGQTLTADTSGIADEDGLTNAVFSYQWVADDANIQGATGSTYTLTEDDEGKAIKVLVSFADDVGNMESRPSAPTDAVAAPPVQNSSATGAPSISGTAQVGQTLTADTSGIADEDGLTNAVFSYQWVADDANIQDATGSSYTLTEDDEGKTIKVTVSFTDAEGNTETLTSAPTGEVAPESGPLTTFTLVDASSDPDTVSGTLDDGGTLALEDPDSDIYGIRVDTDSNHDDHDDIHKVVLALSGAKTEGKEEWQSPYSLYGDEGEENLTGEDLPAGSYTLTATAYDENGDVLGTLTVSFTVEAQQPTVVPNTSATGVPTISGTVQVGQTLTVDTSGIADEDGLTNVVFSYQWMADDTNIQDATDLTYTLTEDDEGKAITVRVSFTDDGNNEESLTSEPTGPVTPDPGPLTVFTVVDTSSDTDTVLGTLEDGGTLTLEDPDSDRHGIRVDTDSNDDIHKVELALSGAKTEGKEEWEFPYSLYGDEGEGNLTGENLPAGAYELKAMAYDDDGDVLGTLKVSFTVTAGQPAQQPAVVPTITGTLQVGQTLTADTSGIADAGGLTNPAFSYQWMADDTNIQDATDPTYTLTEDDEGKTIRVTVSFTDDGNNEETLTSEATHVVAPDPGLLTGFALLDATDQTVVATLSEGDEVGLPDPADGIYAIRADAEPGATIGSVKLELTGAKDVSRTADAAPYSLYGYGADGLHGGVLPAGAYTLRATAYSERDGGGDVLETDAISFTVNSPTTGEPAITGQPRVGKTLTANTSQIADKDGLTHAVFSYQWVRNDGNVDTEIGEANGSTYTLTEDDEGKTLKMGVTFTDDGGTRESAASAPTSRVKAEGDRPTLNGTTVYLTFDDGPHPVYTPQILDVLESYGAKAMFFVTGVNVELYPEIIARMAADGHGIGNHTWSHERLPDLTEEEFTETITRTQNAIGETASPCLRPPYGAITSVGRRLADSLGFQVVMWTLPNPAWDGTWVDSFVSHIVPNLRDGSIVLMHDGDGHGKAVLALNKILEQGTNKGYRFEPVCQPPELGEGENHQNNTATGLPTITGATQVGETLTVDTSGIDDADGLTSPAFSYQWVRSDETTDTDIAGATGSSYTLAEDDEGKTIKVTVSFADDAGNPETLTSDPTGEVAAKPNTQATGAPTIGGIARAGATLTADTSAIADDDGLDNVTFSYQWLAGDVAMAGGSGSGYTLTSAEQGKTVKVRVSFTDDAGHQETRTSAATGEVAALPVPGKPQDLEGEATAQEIELTWTAPTGDTVVEYVVYRGTLQNGSMNGQALSQYATIDAAGKAMTYTDADAEEGVEYRYRVAAVNSAGEGKKSTWLDITAEESSS